MIDPYHHEQPFEDLAGQCPACGENTLDADNECQSCGWTLSTPGSEKISVEDGPDMYRCNHCGDVNRTSSCDECVIEAGLDD